MIGGILAGALPFLREQAESMMIDTCRITSGGAVVTDPNTGVVTRPRVLVYEGKCQVQSRDSSTANPEAGAHTFTVVSRQVKIPANSADVRDGHEVEITSSLLNSFTVGKVYRVDGFTPDSFDTAFRLPVKEVTS
jgi:hypothetical protein